MKMITKTVCFFTWMCVFAVSANDAYSQSQKVSLSYRNVALKTVLKEIENQTKYTFLYSDEVDTEKKVTFEIKDSDVEKALKSLFEGTDLGYNINDNYVVIKKITRISSVQTTKQPGIRITGTVSDNFGELLPGVAVVLRGTTTGTSTDSNGEFTLTVPSDTSVLQFRFIGYRMQEVVVGNRKIIAVTMQEESTELGEVTIVAFGTQKRESIVSSIQTVNTKELMVPSSNLTTAFAGRIAGMISYQTSGEPGYDDAEFFIRGVTTFGAGKVNPLILVDNVEVTTRDLANLHPDDLGSFSILKDATATALYGARGANGVILITTKEGNEGAPKVNLRLETSLSTPTSQIEMADPITYLYLRNEANTTRDPAMGSYYSEYKIFHTIRGTNPYVYPVVDWMDMLIKPRTFNQRANLNISGGGNIARYYVAGSFARDNGIMKVDKRSDFNNNIKSNKYLLHSNINIKLSKNTEMIVRLHGTFNDYNGPLTGGSTLYQRILQVSPVDFPAYYEPVGIFANTTHILYGGDGTQLNPYAEMLKGYMRNSNSTMMAQLELKHDFDKWVKGLKWKIMGNTQRYSAFELDMQYTPFYYTIGSYDRISNEYILREVNSDDGTEYLRYNPRGKSIYNMLYAESSLTYNRVFGKKHDVSGMVVGIIRHYQTANESRLIESLPQRNLGVSGRLTYGYDSRYFAEFNFGYNGSEKFDKGHRWGFFPSVGVGWNVTNEPFFPESLKKKISKLKIRGTYGLVGNDAIGSERFFYISEVVPESGDSFRTGFDFGGYNMRGYRINHYANPNITWEISRKSNLGIEMGLFDGKVDIMTDIFNEHRTNILQTRADVPTEFGLWDTPVANIGKANGKGVDISLDYKQNINPDLWFVARGNFTYARSTYAYFEESDWERFGVLHKTHKGRSIHQRWGYVAEYLFIDQGEIDDSAVQFGNYMPGDLKYKDLNDDGIINLLDQAPIGYPTVPEINYGFGLSAGYKGFDFSFFFSGADRSSFFIDPSAMSPFVERTSPARMNGGLAKFIANDRWTELSQDPYAGWPRLSYRLESNNMQTSTWWMRDRRYLRLKSAEIGYTLPNLLTGKLKMNSMRIYLSGTNLLLFSKFKLWDVELGGNGLNYPLQRVFNLGIHLSF